MSKLAFAAAGSILLLAACGAAGPESAPNSADPADSNALFNSSSADPAPPAAPVGNSDEPVPPPDAVSHPDGYLPPPPPGEAGAANSTGPEAAPPATEDEYIRNRQAGR